MRGDSGGQSKSRHSKGGGVGTSSPPQQTLPPSVSARRDPLGQRREIGRRAEKVSRRPVPDLRVCGFVRAARRRGRKAT